MSAGSEAVAENFLAPAPAALGNDPVDGAGAGVAPVVHGAGVTVAVEQQGAELDILFIMDCTASMGEYIEQAKRTIRSVVHNISRHARTRDGARFGFIRYRDHPPQDSTFVTAVSPFTSSAEEMTKSVFKSEASGGGDGPEAVTAAMHCALHDVDWRPTATKLALIIADAPPHGLPGSVRYGDGFPDGDPQGLDPLEIAREMAAQGVTLYSIVCEPSMGQYGSGRAFFQAVSELTGGLTVALASAQLLAEVMMSSALEEMSLEALMPEVAAAREAAHAAAQREHGREATDDEVLQALEAHFTAARRVVRCAEYVGGTVREPLAAEFIAARSLAEARARDAFNGVQYGDAPVGVTAVRITMSPVLSRKQLQRLAIKCAARAS